MHTDRIMATKYKLELDKARQEVQRLTKMVGHLQYLLRNGMTGKDINAALWVRLHGGVEECERKAESSNRTAEDYQGLCIDIAKLLGHDYEGVYGDGGILDLCDEDRNNLLLSELKSRLMPEGYEWPRYEDGEPVHIGDAVNAHGWNITVEAIEFSRGKVCVKDAEDGDWSTSTHAMHPLKRPQVLAADGEPLEVGQTVWHVDGRGPYEVANFKNPWVRVDDSEGSRSGFWPDNLTHQRPVLDADGVPIHEGDTVWHVSGGEPGTVAYTIPADLSHPDEVVIKGYEDDCPSDARCVTHKRPVLDADGVPIHEGDELWLTNDKRKYIGFNIDGEPLTVSKVLHANSVACLDQRDLSDGSDELWYIHPKCLTHTKPEPPDSWEKFEEKLCYLLDDGDMAEQLTDRAKKLAGVSE